MKKMKMPESIRLAIQQLTGKQVGGVGIRIPAFMALLKRSPAARWFTYAAIPAVAAAALAPIRLPMADIALLLLVLVSAFCVARGIWIMVGRSLLEGDSTNA